MIEEKLHRGYWPPWMHVLMLVYPQKKIGKQNGKLSLFGTFAFEGGRLTYRGLTS
jgi:hypothetical protein